MLKVRNRLFAILIFLVTVSFAQNQAEKWYFGNYAGLDFATTPPTALSNGTLFTSEGCASICDDLGNLLFYTNGVEVYNQAHVIMANGFGLFGDMSSTQSAIIAKKPYSNNLFYIITVAPDGGVNGLNYSMVDMNLAAGMGSVTVKNILLHTPTSEKLAAVKHCNGIDYWIVSHDYNSQVFRSYLLNGAGINAASPVTSTIGIALNNPEHCWGQMKISPNGKKLGFVHTEFNLSNPQSANVQLFDFDAATGVVSNSIVLNNEEITYGCEFSPDGTKFYAAPQILSPSGSMSQGLVQWDLCAGSPAAILSSSIMVYQGADGFLALQLAPDSKIYAATFGASLSVINSPDMVGSACDFSINALSLAPASCFAGLPGFVSTFFKPSSNAFPFSYNQLTCNNFVFTSISSLQTCSAVNPTSVLWSFGDPSSGSANTSSLSVASHSYNQPGTYTVQLTENYSCSSVTSSLIVTVTDVINFSVSGNQTACAAQQTSFTASGASTYTWSNTSNATSMVVSPTVTTVYSVAATASNQCQATNQFTLTVNPSPTLNVAGNFTICPGQSKTYTASGASTYTWQNGNNTPSITLSQTITTGYSVAGTNSLSCIGFKQFTVTIAPCTGMDNAHLQNTGLKIFPNPTSGVFFVETDKVGYLKIMNQLGSVLFEQAFLEGQQLVDLSSYDNGVYTVLFVVEDVSYSVKIIKM